MKRMLFLPVLFAVLLTGTVANAESSQLKYGAGVMVGEPTGLIFTYMTDRRQGFDVGLAWNMDNSGDLYFRTDYQYHFFPLDADDWGDGAWSVYTGIGLRLRFIDGNDDDAGLRFPFGTTYKIGQFPVDVFAEVVPVMNLLPGTSLDWDGNLGVRYWF